MDKVSGDEDDEEADAGSKRKVCPELALHLPLNSLQRAAPKKKAASKKKAKKAADDDEDDE